MLKNENKIEFPCETCLVLGACLGRLSNRRGFDEGNAYSVIVNVLSFCDLLYNFIQPHKSYDYNLTHRYIAKTFFLQKLGKI